MNEQIRTYLNQLSDRDRLWLGVGSIILFFLLFYALMYAPLKRAVDSATLQGVEKRETLAWMKQVRPLAHHGKPAEALDAAQLLTVFSTQLKTTSFHRFPYQLQQAGAKEIQLSYDEVPYNASLDWLSKVSKKYAFSIKQYNVQRTEKAGLVKLLLVIEVA